MGGWGGPVFCQLVFSLHNAQCAHIIRFHFWMQRLFIFSLAYLFLIFLMLAFFMPFTLKQTLIYFLLIYCSKNVIFRMCSTNRELFRKRHFFVCVRQTKNNRDCSLFVDPRIQNSDWKLTGIPSVTDRNFIQNVANRSGRVADQHYFNQLFTLMQIRILLVSKVMGICDCWSLDP
jgi:hypothetical protein